jgi:hypothetical protein
LSNRPYEHYSVKRLKKFNELPGIHKISWYSICYLTSMKKQNLISAILFGLCISLTAVSAAQNRRSVTPVEKGSITFNAGVGVGTQYNSNYYNSAFGTKAALEAGLWQAGPGVITLGIEAGSSFSSGGIYDNYKTSTFVVAGRSAWHHGWNINGLDTYAGLSAGVGFQHYQYDKNGYVNQNEVIPVFGGFVGASYFITPTFGFNVEAGNDITQIQGGIIIKIK